MAQRDPLAQLDDDTALAEHFRLEALLERAIPARPQDYSVRLKPSAPDQVRVIFEIVRSECFAAGVSDRQFTRLCEAGTWEKLSQLVARAQGRKQQMEAATDA
jgi:hypothetical protein